MDIERDLFNSELPVVADFYATWCGPCKMMAPNIERLAQEFEGKLVVKKIDVDAEPFLAQSFNVSTIPTVMIFKGGKVVASHVGAMPYELLQNFVKAAL